MSEPITLAKLLIHRDPLVRRFAGRVTVLASGCWQWSSVRASDGYGTFTVTGDRCYVPQCWLYERFIGEIPPTYTLDHVCRNRGCVNVFDEDHIEAVPHAVNIARALGHSSQVNAAKTHCPRGHEYNEINTYINFRGSRICRVCGRERRREARAQERVAS